MKLRKTRINVPSNSRSTVIGVLDARLADSIDLALLTKQAHWNLRGKRFIAVHEMLDRFRAELDANTDTIAERIVQLGGLARGTTQAVAEVTTLKPYPLDIVKIDDHLAALAERYGKVANEVRAGIAAVEAAGDAATADLLTGYSRALDKALWFLEAHIET